MVTELRGVTANVLADQVILRDLEFGGVHYRWKTATKLKLPSAKTLAPGTKHVGGLIGMDVLGDFDLDLDFPHRKLTLYHVKGCRETPLPGFTGFNSIPFRHNEHRNILFPFELEGKKLIAFLDTGAVLHSVTRAGGKKAGLTAEMLSADKQIDISGAGDIAAKVPLHKFNTLSIGGVEQPGVLFEISEPVLGTGGCAHRAVLSAHAARLDFERDPHVLCRTQASGSAAGQRSPRSCQSNHSRRGVQDQGCATARRFLR